MNEINIELDKYEAMRLDEYLFDLKRGDSFERPTFELITLVIIVLASGCMGSVIYWLIRPTQYTALSLNLVILSLGVCVLILVVPLRLFLSYRSLRQHSRRLSFKAKDLEKQIQKILH